MTNQDAKGEQARGQAIVYRIFLASPRDVRDERELARTVIEQIRAERAFRGRVNLECIAWDQPGAEVAMDAGLTPQEAIKRDLPKPSQCNLVIVILWSRMGTPLPDEYTKPDGTAYLSGTEWEYQDAITASKRFGRPAVWIYRKKQTPSVQLDDPNKKEKERQWDKVEAFFQRLIGEDGSLTGGVNAYQTPDEFRRQFEQHLRDRLTIVLEELLGSEKTAAPSQEREVEDRALWTDTPYPGLEAFKPEQAPIFFGRGPEVDQLLEVLRDPAIRFIAVVGASGSGKSSLVAAGLIPRLRAGALPGSSQWVDIIFKPGERGGDPFLALAYALKAVFGMTGRRETDLAEELRAKPDSFASFVDQFLSGSSPAAEFLLVVDQFEEIFTLVPVSVRATFFELIETVTKTPKVRIIVTMRAEFLANAVEMPILAEMFRGRGFFSLSAPGVLALTEMIRRPAQMAGYEIRDDLCDRILQDTGTGAGALALMAFALHEVYEHGKASGQFTLQDYESLDGVAGAIQSQAERALERLGQPDDRTLHALFSDLMEVNDQGVATRRRAALEQIRQDPPKARLADAMVAARILVTDQERSENPTIEVAHEAVFTGWPRLKKWIEDTSDDLRLRRQISQAAVEWEESEQSEKYLWSEERVLDVVRMLDRLGPAIKPLSYKELSFLGPIDPDIMKAELDDLSTDHERRATIGVRQSLFGYTRHGVGVRPDGIPDIDWCKVPAGKITLEEIAVTFQVESFSIARYPVTCEQYRSFLEAKDGYRNIDWWEGLAERQDQTAKQYQKFDNHPAVNVPWFNAVAFCRWLTKRLDYEIQLPTEWEWQQAATGGDPANEYPWGPAWERGRANTYESGLQKTTAVGLYPHGASPVGAQDMSGNVWEWCLNEYENIDRYRDKLDVECRRSVRGGSWLSDQDLARCGYRDNRDLPQHRLNRVGFRLLCSSPIL